MVPNFSEVMAGKSDADLLEIITKLREDYQPEAVEAAEEQFKQRNLNVDQLKQVEEEVHEKSQRAEEKAVEPLSATQKIMFLIFFWGIVPWAMAGTFKADGYIRKHKDAWRFMKIGLAVFFGLPVLLLLILSQI